MTTPILTPEHPYFILSSEEQAQNRVNNHPELRPYYDLLCEYDWPNWTEHIEWVRTAPIAEIVDWAQGIREAELEAEAE